MAIITISRQLGSQGTDIARLLAENLQYRLLDKAALSKELEPHGIYEMDRFDEKKPGLYDTVMDKSYPYVHCMQSALYHFAEAGDCIILGRGGQFLFRPLPGVLKVNIIAPRYLRLERIRSRFGRDRQTTERILQDSDNERAGFHRFFFNIDWSDPGIYDLVINTQNIDLEMAADIIAEARLPFEAAQVQEKTRLMLKDFCLANEVITNIYQNKHIPVHYLRAMAENGTVTLEGGVMNRGDIRVCEHAALEIEGTRKVITHVSVLNSCGIA